MAEKHHRTQPLQGTQHIISVVGDHRSNNLVYGHVGRLTYVSLEDADEQENNGRARQTNIGELHTNRMTTSNSTFQVLTDFRTWYPATKQAAVEEGQVAENHNLWLWEHAPSVLVGTTGPWDGLTKEFEAAASIKPFEAKLPLLAYGEIANHSGWIPSTCSAFATAAGSLGHILRIVRTHEQEVGWARTYGSSLDFTTADTADEGHWCSSVPISQIKFTAPAQTESSLRWVLAQTDIATFMLEPVLQEKPVQTAHAACSYVSRGPSRISVNLVMQISAEDTGGEPHNDVSFNPGLDGAASQLAIIDKGGNWSVWDIKVNPKAHKNRIHRSIRTKGRFIDGIPTALPPAGVHGRRSLYRVVWLPAANSEMGETGDTQCRTLLMCNDVLLKAINVESQEPVQIVGVTRQNGLDALLDIHLCSTEPSRVFVLTSTTVFWLDLALVDSGTGLESTIASHDETAKGQSQKKHPAVLLSCPHLRDPTDGTLKLCVAPSRPFLGRNASLVCVYSTTHAEVSVFRFAEPGLREQACFEQQLFRLRPPTKQGQQGRHGEQSILVLPKAVQEDLGGRTGRGRRDVGLHYTAAGVRFFQVIALGPNLDLRSATCVSTPPFGKMKMHPPTAIRKHRLAQKHGKIGENTKSCSQSFVVPDDVGTASLVERQMARPKQRGFPIQIQERIVPVLNLSRVFYLLGEQVDKTAKAAEQAVRMVRGFQNPSPLDVIRRIIQVGIENGNYPYTTLLDAVEGNFIDDFGADLTDLSWAQRLADLDLGDDRQVRVRVFDQVMNGAGLRHSRDVTTLYQAMGALCETTEEVASTRRAGLLESVAVRLYFSLISMCVEPRQMGRSNATTPMDSEASPGSSQGVWRAAVPKARSAERLDRMEMSSSPPQQLSWPPSSQGDPSNREGEETDEVGEEEDATIARLRQYAVSIKSEAPRAEGELRLLSHWKLGSDPTQFWWKPVGSMGGGAEEEKKQAEEEALERRRKRNEKKARRERERMARLMGDGISTPSAPRIQMSQVPELATRSSPVLPSQPFSSQPFSSQFFSSQLVPRSSQMMASSQPFGGGHRPKKNKAKRVGGFRKDKIESKESDSPRLNTSALTEADQTIMSHQCHDEHASHGGHDDGHGHGDGDGDSHDHDHDHDHDHSDDVTPALQQSLYQHIDFDQLITLNEAAVGAGRAVVRKTWAQRLEAVPELASDADEQLLMAVPFTGQVKLHAILLRTSTSTSAPRTLHVFQNRDDMDFAAAEDEAAASGAAQTFELAQTSEVQELAVRRAVFAQVRRLTLFFPDNFGAGEEDVTRLSYVGFRGTWMQLGRAPVNILYEAAANPADHAVRGTTTNRMGSDMRR
ncbi:duf1000 domain containing protein [Grosmannia clavigera kw1407]|uniref:Duf1000 domain containing protein n=1 Tax=Grosmannia clavigera (strain kw1407 / UAMH 11150) TaxID=655863 RepID=F0XTS9_GROCL|nr:duf1000 domain containing protein [Grosmannia clavigera kw1407]EFW98789.1 duf1000 domain containing protein [Grosmannia clavigera kw1407]